MSMCVLGGFFVLFILYWLILYVSNNFMIPTLSKYERYGTKITE